MWMLQWLAEDPYLGVSSGLHASAGYSICVDCSRRRTFVKDLVGGTTLSAAPDDS